MPTFLDAGSIAYDMLLHYDGSFADGIDPEHLENLSVGFVTQRLVKRYGGTAANIAWNFRLLGQDICISGSVGGDGEEYLQRLQEKGIALDHVQRRVDETTATAIIASDTGERQITFFHPGADYHTTPPDIATLKSSIGFVIISPHSATAMERTALLCEEHGVPYVFDPGQQSLQFGRGELERIVKGAKGVIVNAYEWSLLTDHLGWTKDDILEHADWIIGTQGEHGVGIQTQEESIVIGSVPAERFVDPTGAGDAFRAGLLTGLGRDWDIQDAARLGAAIASFVVEDEGTQIEELGLEEMYQRAERAYGIELPVLG
jgi:adenosine kinase